MFFFYTIIRPLIGALKPCQFADTNTSKNKDKKRQKKNTLSPKIYFNIYKRGFF